MPLGSETYVFVFSLAVLAAHLYGLFVAAHAARGLGGGAGRVLEPGCYFKPWWMGRPVPCSSYVEACRRVAEAGGCRPGDTIVVTDVSAPAYSDIQHGVIVVARWLLDRLEPRELAHVLEHERWHIRHPVASLMAPPAAAAVLAAAAAALAATGHAAAALAPLAAAAATRVLFETMVDLAAARSAGTLHEARTALKKIALKDTKITPCIIRYAILSMAALLHGRGAAPCRTSRGAA